MVITFIDHIIFIILTLKKNGTMITRIRAMMASYSDKNEEEILASTRSIKEAKGFILAMRGPQIQPLEANRLHFLLTLSSFPAIYQCQISFLLRE